MSYYTTSQKAAIDRDARNMALAGIPLSAILDNLQTLLTQGNLGITSDARDVDSLTLGGGACTWDADTTTGSTLAFAIKVGRVSFGQSTVAVAPQTITLATATTNYVELTKLGVLASNTGGFTAGNLPLYTVVTGASTYTAGNVVSAKVLLSILGNNSVGGALLSTPAQTKEVVAQLGASIAATSVFLIPAPNVAATLVRAALVNSTAFAGDDTNYWTFAIANLGPSGGGATAMLAATAANTTKATGGSAITAGKALALTLHGAPGTDANLNTAAGDVLQLTITKTAAAANLTLAAIGLDFTFQS
jgi:hypothetical protein